MSIFGSMKTAVSGMNAQANKLSTVSDNIANVNTTGYKSASTSFSSLILPSGGGNYNSGSVETNVSYSVTQQGDTISTSSSSDLSIQGAGFFVVQGADGKNVLTRAGDFTPDANGNLVNSAGYTLMGYSYASGAPAVVVNGFDGLVPINVNQSGLANSASTSGSFTGNLNSNATVVTDATTLPGMRNSLKCLQALTNLQAAVHGYKNVCDLGCGSGAFSVAFAYLAGNPGLELHGLDVSAHQLSLARELMSAAELPGRFQFEQRNLPAQIGYRPDLTISSYWFCENEHVISDPALFDLMVGRELLIVDYEKIIDRIATCLPDGFHILARYSAHVEIPAALTDFVAQERASVYSLHIGRTSD